MNPQAQAKLNELRGKTNRQLASLISNRLDRGLAFARVLEGEQHWATTDHFVKNAEYALADAETWLTLLVGATQSEARRLETKRQQLRDALDRHASPRMAHAAY